MVAVGLVESLAQRRGLLISAQSLESLRSASIGLVHLLCRIGRKFLERHVSVVVSVGSVEVSFYLGLRNGEPQAGERREGYPSEACRTGVTHKLLVN